jgi:hypothetical protein
MAAKCFLSFHYKPDNWRVSQIKQMGVIEGQALLAANKWEEVKGKGDAAIKQWIADNMKGRDCLIALGGSDTAGRKWIKHEITEAWKAGMAVMGIYIHNLKDSNGNAAVKGGNPFSGFTVGGKPLTTYATMYDPPVADTYNYISNNLTTWVAAAIKARKTA